jgi:hypothetical protein
MPHSTINASLDNRSPDPHQRAPGFFEPANHYGSVPSWPRPRTILHGLETYHQPEFALRAGCGHAHAPRGGGLGRLW